MLSDVLNNISTLLGINSNIIPNIITIIVIVIIVAISLGSGLPLQAVGFIYIIVMVILRILGIDSEFNIIYLIEQVFNIIVDLIF